MKIDSKLRTVVVKSLKEAKILDPMEKKSVVCDRPDEKQWEQLKHEEIKRLMNNSNGKGVKEYE